VYYNAADTLRAAQLYHAAAKANPALLQKETFCYDYVDVVRQAISDCGRPLLAEARNRKDARQEFLKMILSTDIVLEGAPLFRMDLRETAARKYGKNRAVIALRRMYTTWSGRSGKLNDYAHRQLSGLMRYYYYQRWKDFFDAADQTRSYSHTARDNAYLNRAIAKVKAPSAGELINRVGLVLDFVEKIHKKYPDRFRPTAGVPWVLPKVAPPACMTFSVSEYITAAGRYDVEIKWTSGPHALKIEKVELYEGNKLVASDVHAGSTGIRNSNNVYTLDVKTFRTGLEDYELRVTCSGDGGNNSSGIFIITPKK
jgi:alpha-N-acetylglucosaminidase